MRMFISMLTFFLLFNGANAQTYISPVKHTITLAGAFGEIRSSHFHAGIDIRPSAKAIDTIYAVADGYLSRVKTQRGGFGRAVYIDHPDGNTSVYAHLSVLLKPIESYVYQAQMKDESYEVDLYPEANSIKIKKGQAIGLMGNAGNSYGKHLHFEIRDTKSEVPKNPFLFGIKAGDNIKPTISYCTIHGLSPDLNDVHRTRIGNKFSSTEGGTIPTYAIPAWRAGISVYAFDQMKGSSNRNGYYEMKMFVDDSLFYYSKMDAVSYEEGDLLDAYVDYTTKSETGRREALLYRMPANKVSAIKYLRDDGTIPLFAGSKRKVCLEVSDFDGNKSFAYWYMVRDTAMKGNVPHADCDTKLKVEKAQYLSFPGGKLSIDAYTTPNSTGFSVSRDSAGITIGCRETAILKSIELCLDDLDSSSVSEKMIFAKIDETTPSSTGAYWSAGKYCTSINATGRYGFITDDKAPSISPGRFSAAAAKYSQFTFELRDNIRYSGQAKTFEYKVFVDGKFIPCEMKELVKTLYVPISQLSPGKHELLITAMDYAGNKSSFSRTFTK
ncbi:MAG: M23 family metallopeptidase [Saprospiraceae bacterium]|nr:M23 family metallopeptidase [Saprospiraceae bacterium]